MSNEGHGESSPHSSRGRRDSQVSFSADMYSDQLTSLLIQVADAHSKAMNSMKSSYETQLHGRRREWESTSTFHSGTPAENLELQAKGISENAPVAVERTTINDRTSERKLRPSISFSELVEVDAPLPPHVKKCSVVSLDALDLDLEDVECLPAGELPVGELPALGTGSEGSTPRAHSRTTSRGSREDRRSNSSFLHSITSSSTLNMNRNLNLRNQWRVHPEQDEKDLLAEMLNRATVHDGMGPRMVRDDGCESSLSSFATFLDGPRRCRDSFVATPGANWRLCWDISGAVLIGYDTLMIPFTLAFEPGDHIFFTALNWITMLFWTLDMILTFFVGYVTTQGVTVMALDLIATRYLRTWFVLDIVVIGGDWFNNIGEALKSSQDGNVGSTARLMRSLRTARVLRLLRLIKLKRMMAELQDHITSEITYLLLSLLRLLFFILFINHLIACGWWSLGVLKMNSNQSNWITYNKCENTELGYKYTTSLHWTLTQFTPAAMEIFPQNTAERTMSVVVLLLALAVFSSFLGSISANITSLRNMNSDVNKQFWMLRRYLKQHGVSKLVARRILRYLEYVLEKKYGNVQQTSISILGMLSEQLKEDLTYELSYPKICEQMFFQYFVPFPLMDVVMRKICFLALKTITVASGDHLFYPGDEAKCVHCFLSGNMEYFPEDFQPVDPPVMEKEWIGEAALWMPWKYSGRFAAEDESELITVDIDQFIRLLSTNVLSWKYASRYATMFLEQLKGCQYRSDLIRDEVMLDSLMEDLTQEHQGVGLYLKMKKHIQMQRMKPARASASVPVTARDGRQSIAPVKCCL